MRKVHLYIDGRVRSVGFRNLIKQKADELKVMGYVRNIEDGLEVVAEGEDGAVEKLIAICRKGPSADTITNFTVEEQDPGMFYAEFSIRP
jgi:acylphosphatase